MPNLFFPPTLSHYKGTEPALDIREYFTGPVKAWGILQDWRGHVTRRFTVDLHGAWDGDTGTLDEYFRYDDGESDRRTWHITKDADGRYTGRADDIDGTAQGKASGFAVRWAYKMKLDVKGTTYRIAFDDWMFRLEADGVLFNRSYLKKFGLTVAELTIFMQKQTEGA